MVVETSNGSQPFFSEPATTQKKLGGRFKYILMFTPKIGEDSHFDSYFSDGLVQPHLPEKKGAQPPLNAGFLESFVSKSRLWTRRSWAEEMDGSVVKEDLERKGSHHEKVLRTCVTGPTVGERNDGRGETQPIYHDPSAKNEFSWFFVGFFFLALVLGRICVEGEMRGWIGIEFVEIEILCKSVKENHLNDYLYAGKSLGLLVDA